MTTKQGKSGKYFTDPATRPREGFLAGLSGPEAVILRDLLETLYNTGKVTSHKTEHIRNILVMLNENLLPSGESSEDSNHQQQLRELRQTLQEYRRKLTELEERIEDLEVGDMLV